eukprot:XP_011668323.1 PREDICTED: calcium-activated chloride channel regulator 4A-like [Strongylocentrotus purpuratus]
MFTSASQRLYLATKQHVYWSHIKILVPNTWSIQGQYQLARTETSQSANILVHDFKDDEPYVKNVVGCGKQGTLMHITPAYILNVQDREDKFGNTDSVLVRNWGYYRWGLFKEHYDRNEGTASAYDSPGGDTEGTRCSLKIRGNLVLSGSNGCPSSPFNGYNPDCRFVPDTAGQTARASLLFGDAPIHSIEEFCDDDTSDRDSLHNPLAPNLMNKLCNESSAWSVMRDHTDFQAGIQPVSNTSPVYEVIQLSSVRSVVLVLDISGSMGVLNSSTKGKYMLLLTDGVENVTPYIRDTYDDIENSGVIIDTITISNAADQQMEDLSTNTSGTSSFCSDTGIGNCLMQAFQSTIAERPEIGMETVPVQIYSSEVFVEPDPGFYNIPVVIDAALGNETVIVVIWTKSKLISVVVTGPGGTRVDQNDPRYHIDMNKKIVTINLPLAQKRELLSVGWLMFHRKHNVAGSSGSTV